MPIAQPVTKRRTFIMDCPQCQLPVGLPHRYFNPGELNCLVALAAACSPSRIVEFGCNDGHAAAVILHNIPTIERYVGIDVMPGYVTKRECQRNEVPTHPGHLVRTDPRFLLLLSGNGSFDLRADDLGQCDFAFIDADHSREGVLNDYWLARQIVRRGGMIVFHDDNGLPAVQVSETLDELNDGGAVIDHVAETWLAFERM